MITRYFISPNSVVDSPGAVVALITACAFWMIAPGTTVNKLTVTSLSQRTEREVDWNWSKRWKEFIKGLLQQICVYPKSISATVQDHMHRVLFARFHCV